MTLEGNKLPATGDLGADVAFQVALERQKNVLAGFRLGIVSAGEARKAYEAGSQEESSTAGTGSQATTTEE